MRVIAAVILVCTASGAFASDAADRWAHEYWQAHRAFLKIFESHPRLTDRFIEESHDDAGQVSDWIQFLAEKPERTTDDFVKKRGRDAKGIKHMVEDFHDEIHALRVWTHDYTEAAFALARIKGGAAAVLKMTPFEERKEIRRDERRDDRRDGR